jgi:hypothetical protein
MMRVTEVSPMMRVTIALLIFVAPAFAEELPFNRAVTQATIASTICKPVAQASRRLLGICGIGDGSCLYHNWLAGYLRQAGSRSVGVVASGPLGGHFGRNEHCAFTRCSRHVDFAGNGHGDSTAACARHLSCRNPHFVAALRSWHHYGRHCAGDCMAKAIFSLSGFGRRGCHRACFGILPAPVRRKRNEFAPPRLVF